MVRGNGRFLGMIDTSVTRASVEGHAQPFACFGAVGKVERIHGGLGPRVGHPAGAGRHPAPLIDEAFQHLEPAFAAHLVIVAAKSRGELEFAEIEAADIDPVDGHDPVCGRHAVLGISRIGGKIAAKPAGQRGNGGKTQAMARSLHGSNPLARPRLLEPRGNVEVFAGFVNWSLAELCGSALTPNCRPRICPATAWHCWWRQPLRATSGSVHFERRIKDYGPSLRAHR